MYIILFFLLVFNFLCFTSNLDLPRNVEENVEDINTVVQVPIETETQIEETAVIVPKDPKAEKSLQQSVEKASELSQQQTTSSGVNIAVNPSEVGYSLRKSDEDISTGQKSKLFLQ